MSKGFQPTGGDTVFRPSGKASDELMDGDEIVMTPQCNVMFCIIEGLPHWQYMSRWVPVSWYVLDWIFEHGAMIRRFKCRICGGVMQMGIATPDAWPTGVEPQPLKPIRCVKCKDCGWSVR